MRRTMLLWRPDFELSDAELELHASWFVDQLLDRARAPDAEIVDTGNG